MIRSLVETDSCDKKMLFGHEGRRNASPGLQLQKKPAQNGNRKKERKEGRDPLLPMPIIVRVAHVLIRPPTNALLLASRLELVREILLHGRRVR
jgi:hypothetical protein